MQVKSPWKSKTLWLHLLSGAFAAAELNVGLLQGLVEPKTYLLILFVVNVVAFALRFETKHPIK